MRRGSIAAAVAVLAMLLLASAAQADTANILESQRPVQGPSDGWQAGPCTADPAGGQCSAQTPGLFFKQAGGHPPAAFVQFIIRHGTGTSERLLEPIEPRIPKTVRVDLPPGLSINPEATAEKCTQAEFFQQPFGKFTPACRGTTQIGEARVKIVAQENLAPSTGIAIPAGTVLSFTAPLFNIEPSPGEPALFGMVIAESLQVLLRPRLAWESDYHEIFTIESLPDYQMLPLRILGNALAPIAIHTARLITFGNAGDGSLATLPTTCLNSDEVQFRHLYSSWIRVESYGEPNPSFPAGNNPFESALPPGVHPEGCASVPFEPTVEIDPGSADADSAAAPRITARLGVHVPGRGGGPIAESDLRSAEVTLPADMSLNPGGAAGLEACTDAQFHKGDRVVESECPEDSEIGSAEIRSPVLAQPLTGKVYVGEPKSADPASGEEFRAFVEAKVPERGVVVRLIGKIKADPASGQLSAAFDEQEESPLFGALPRGLPQLPLESVTLRLNNDHRILSTPRTCAPEAMSAALEPWARPGTEVSASSEFTLSSSPGSEECPQTLGQRPFSPTYTAGPDSSQAGAYSPFRLHLLRPEGQQELKGVDLALPTGLLGKLAGIPYCPEEAIAAAAGRSGAAEAASPSCPAASQVGATAAEAGTGEQPLSLPGKAYLAGPYKGAPLSLVAITPALSGPFDLGDVVIRVALHVDPASAQIHAVSDPFPDLFGAVRLDLRAIDISLDRPRFTLNPTSCAPQDSVGAIAGGGSDPANPAAFSSFPLDAPFQASGCEALGFAPSLTTTLSGPTRKSGYPRLSAVLQARPGDANIASVSLLLPHSFFVAQEHFAAVCTRPQLASHSCPPSSAYGEAEARSPLLDRPLAGPVYLVPGGGKLPDLVADLHGQIDVQLRGAVGSRKGGIEATFGSVPDVPVSEFALRMAGGRKGLIVNSTDICKRPKPAKLTIRAQNGKQLTSGRYKLNLAGCKRHGAPRRHKRHRKHKHTKRGKRQGHGVKQH